ncbi:MAG: hypothetical protein U0Z44_21850 [Kouleothrix sp.]
MRDCAGGRGRGQRVWLGTLRTKPRAPTPARGRYLLAKIVALNLVLLVGIVIVLAVAALLAVRFAVCWAAAVRSAQPTCWRCRLGCCARCTCCCRT